MKDNKFQFVLYDELHTAEKVADDKYRIRWCNIGLNPYPVYDEEKVEKFINKGYWKKVIPAEEVEEMLLNYKMYVNELLQGLQAKVDELKAEVNKLRNLE